MNRHFFHNFFTIAKAWVLRDGVKMSVLLSCFLFTCASPAFAAEDTPASKEYFHHQQANTALLITLEAFEAEFESRIYGPDNALLAVAGVPQLRLGPVFQFLDAVDKARQIRIDITMGHRSAR